MKDERFQFSGEINRSLHSHPEIKPGEICVGNYNDSSFDKLPHKSKRKVINV